MALILT
jgi:WD40 repeat protein